MIETGIIIAAVLIALFGLLLMAVGIGQVLRESQRESRCACCLKTHCDRCHSTLCPDCDRCYFCCKCGSADA